MTQNDLEYRPANRRGRPVGSSPLAAPDEKTLRRAARLSLQKPEAKITHLLREVGALEDVDLRRLRRKWRDVGSRLIEEERLLWDQRTTQGFLGEIGYHAELMAEWVADVIGTLRQGDLAATVGRAARNIEARKRRGIVPEPPLGTHDPAAVADCVARFEMRSVQDIDALIAQLPADAVMADMPASVKYYAQALVYYGLYEAALAEEVRLHVQKGEGS